MDVMQTDNPLILVVDDQPGVRRLVQEVFGEIGYRVLSAANGYEALELCRQHRPRVVLLDMKMPVLDGLEALKELKQLYPSLVVFMMTAVGDGERINEAISSGAHTCINKPFDVFALRTLVEGVLQQEGGRV